MGKEKSPASPAYVNDRALLWGNVVLADDQGDDGTAPPGGTMSDFKRIIVRNGEWMACGPVFSIQVDKDDRHGVNVVPCWTF